MKNLHEDEKLVLHFSTGFSTGFSVLSGTIPIPLRKIAVKRQFLSVFWQNITGCITFFKGNVENCVERWKRSPAKRVSIGFSRFSPVCGKSFFGLQKEYETLFPLYIALQKAAISPVFSFHFWQDKFHFSRTAVLIKNCVFGHGLPRSGDEEREPAVPLSAASPRSVLHALRLPQPGRPIGFQQSASTVCIPAYRGMVRIPGATSVDFGNLRHKI